jgi:hypothetical protein
MGEVSHRRMSLPVLDVHISYRSYRPAWPCTQEPCRMRSGSACLASVKIRRSPRDGCAPPGTAQRMGKIQAGFEPVHNKSAMLRESSGGTSDPSPLPEPVPNRRGGTRDFSARRNATVRSVAAMARRPVSPMRGERVTTGSPRGRAVPPGPGRLQENRNP